MNISLLQNDFMSKYTMNGIKITLSVICFCLCQAVFASTSTKVFSVNDRYSDIELKEQVLQLSTNLDIQYNSEIKGLINTYLSSGRKSSEIILGRSKYYFPIMENIIEKHNLPEELKFLSVIESGLRPSVRSKAGAVGLWQFMSSTAKMYDLNIYKSHDERKDVARSTEAALLYLTDLYNRYDDWTLALAAYNCGPGNVNKAIRRAGGKKRYWEIRKYLPRETRKYLPKMIATMYVMNYFTDYGLTDENYEFSNHTSFAIATIHEKTKLTTISNSCGLSVEEIRKFNPSYAYSYIPASKRGNNLILPEVHLLTYLQNTQKLHQLSEVFYLKNTLFSLSVDPIEEIVEMVRMEVNSDYINTPPLQEIKGNNMPFTLEKHAVKSTPVIAEYKLVRLRKRQTLSSYIEEQHIDLTKMTAEVNEQGVVKLYRK